MQASYIGLSREFAQKMVEQPWVDLSNIEIVQKGHKLPTQVVKPYINIQIHISTPT